MKRNIFLFCIILITQASKAQITYGIDVALIQNTQQLSNSKYSADTRLSWKAGGVINWPLGNHFELMPQVNLIIKGGKWNYADKYINEHYTERLNYLEVPVYLLYKIANKTGSAFVLGAGPVFSYGLGGKKYGIEDHSNATPAYYKHSAVYQIKFDGSMNSNDGIIHYNPFEIGIGFLAGYQLSNGFFINGHYNIGLSNVLSESMPDNFKNNYVGLGIGYVLSHK